MPELPESWYKKKISILFESDGEIFTDILLQSNSQGVLVGSDIENAEFLPWHTIASITLFVDDKLLTEIKTYA